MPQANRDPFPDTGDATAWQAPDLRKPTHGETLAILALLTPLVGLAISMSVEIHSFELAYAISAIPVFITAILLAIDAALLGRTDLNGKDHGSPVALFFFMLLLWIVAYPMAYFRRRHFGRPNMGFIALLVAVIFLGVPIARDFTRFGTIHGVPSCDSKEVVKMVDSIIRQGAGIEVLSITGHRETRFDSVNKIRYGECHVKTRAEDIPVAYTVRLIDAKLGTFQVQIEP